MPRIPIATFTPQATPSQAVRGDMGMFDGMAAGQRALAGGIASIGGALHDFSEKKQAAVNFATVADANRQMDAAFSDYQDKLRNNGDEKTYIPDWQKDVSTLEKNLAVEKMPPALRGQMQLRLKDWKQETTQNVRSIATARQINRAGTQVELAAADMFKNGRNKEAIAMIKNGEKTNLYSPEKATDLIKQQSNGAYYANYDRKISDIGQLNAAAKVIELSKLENELTQVDEKGVLANGRLYDADGKHVGGLDDPARNKLIQNLRGMKKSAANAMESETGRIISVFSATRSVDEVNAQADEAYQRGDIDAELWIGKDEKTGSYTFKGAAVGDFNYSLHEANKLIGPAFARAAKEDELDTNSAELKLLKAKMKQQETAQSLVGMAQSGKLSVDAINKREKEGEIAPDHARELRKTVEAIAANELSGVDKLPIAANAKNLMGKPLSDVRGAIRDYRQAADIARSDITRRTAQGAEKMDNVTTLERKAWIASVNKLPISIEAKSQLMRDYIDAYKVDLVGFEKRVQGNSIFRLETAGGNTGAPKITHLSGRDLSTAEVMARTKIAERWALASNLGEDWSGELLLSQERRLESFFMSSDYADNEVATKKATEMAAEMADEVSSISAHRLLEQSIPFGITGR
jgi:hypothetical protein